MVSGIFFTNAEAKGVSLIAKEISEQGAKKRRTISPQEYREEQQVVADVRGHSVLFQEEKEEIAGVPCEWVYTQRTKDDPRVILYIHGGSWMWGNMDTAKPVAQHLARYAKIKVLMIDYRLAPEHIYPAGFDDVYKVYNYLIEHHYSPVQIGLLGDSAGGNLSLCLINKLKEEGKPLPACVGCASPVTDMREESFIVKSDDDLIYTTIDEKEQTIFQAYLGEDYQTKANLPTVSPIMGDLTDLPPILIHTGGDEPISKDNIAYGEKVLDNGGVIEVKVWKDMFHDFSIVGPSLRESRQSMIELGRFYKTQLRR